VITLAGQFADAGRAAGFRVERYGESEGCPLFALTRRTPGPRPRLYLSTGIPWRRARAASCPAPADRRGFFDRRAHWFLCPLINPAGLARGTRENADGLDLNRDYKDRRSAEIRAHIAWLERQPPFDFTMCCTRIGRPRAFTCTSSIPTTAPPSRRR